MRLPVCVASGCVVLFALGHAAGVRAELNCDPGIEFHPEGGILRCTLNGDHTLTTRKGLRLTCASGHTITKFPDGGLRSCTLAVSYTGEDRTCAERSRVELDSDGELNICDDSWGSSE